MASLWILVGVLCSFSTLAEFGEAASCAVPEDAVLTRPLVASLVSRIQAIIRQVLAADTERHGVLYNPLVAGYVRLIFHVCAGARCSSYIDLSDPANNGLQPVVNSLEGLYATLLADPAYRGFSKADLYALAAIAALEMATDFKKSIEFRYGRTDFCPGDNVAALKMDVPSRALGTNGTLNYFRRVFGFDRFETAAIMGAHSLGLVHNFGTLQPVARWWDGNPARLSNDYYKNLQISTWRQVGRAYNGLPYRLAEWQTQPARPTRLMLNSDMGLVKIIDVYNKTTGAATCVSYSSCRLADTASIVAAFANNSTLFLDSFVAVFEKMMNHGYAASDLRLPTDNADTS